MAYEDQLRRLVDQAWDLRGGPYYRDALEAIVELHYHRLELEEQELWDELRKMDPFVRRCVTQFVNPNERSGK